MLSLAQLVGGSIGSNQCITSGTSPASFTSIAPATGGTGLNFYLWQRSTSPTFTTFSTVGNTETFTETSTLTQTTYYRRRVDNDSEFGFSNTITVNILPTATLTALNGVNSACQNSTSPPSVVITSTAGTAPFTYTYRITDPSLNVTNHTVVSNISGTAQLTVPTTGITGTYTYELLQIESSSLPSCTNASTATLSMTINPNPTILISPGNPSICQGTSSFDIQYLTTNSPDRYSIQWAGDALTEGFPDVNVSMASANLTTITGTITVSVSNTAPAGTYSGTLTVRNNATTCSFSGTAQLIVNALPTPVINASGPLTFCSGNSVNLTASGGNTYAWSNGTNAAITNITTSGTYSVTVTDVNSCQSITSTTVTVNALPTPVINASGPLTFCSGNSVNLTASGGNTYAWSNGINTALNTINTSGTYTVTVTDVNSCQSITSTTVTVNALPTPVINASGPLTFCSGNSVNLTASGGNTYAWSNGINTALNTINTSGTYTVTVTDGNGCQNTASRIVTVNALPVANINASGPLTFCAGNSVTLTGTGGNNYAWSNGINTASNTINTSGTYTVTVTDGNGCQNTASRIVTVNALPVANINASGPLTFCAGNSVNLTASGGNTYAWSNGINTASNTINTSGTYTVTVTDGNGCQNTASRIVTVNALPVANINASGPLTFCAGNSVTLTGTGGNNYAWSNGINTASNTINTSGTYTVTVTDGNGCQNTASRIVTVNALPVANINASGPLTFCAGNSVTLTGTGGNNYAWSNGINTASNTINTSGTYTVTVTNGNGCQNTASRIVTVNPLPSATITASGPLTFCAGNSVNLTANNAVSYLWSNGATSNTLSNITNSGTFSVTITDAKGCSNTAASVVVTVNVLPTLNITNPTPICSPGTVNLTAAAITTGSSAGLQYSYWTNATATTALTAPSSVGTSGTYYIRAIETINNCSVIRPVTVAILPQAAMVVNTPAAVCAPNTIDITTAAVTNGSTAGLTYTYFIDALGTVSLNNANAIAQSGTYYIKGTPAAGCSTVVPVQVIINPPPVLVVNNPTAVCAPSLIDLTRNEITAGSENNLRFNYYIDAALNAEIGSPAQINNSGTYYIRATSNVTGCRSSLPVSVTVNPIPSGQLQTPPVNFICENSTLTLTASGSANYQWLRNGQTIPGATTATYDAATAGTYTVRFTSAQGCTRQASENIVLELLSQPIVDFAVTNACVGVSASFQNRSRTNNAGGINWLWEFGDGSSSNQFSTQYAYITPGVYQVRLTASNPNCAVSASKTMEYIVRTAARSVRYPDVETLRGVAVTVNARSNIGNQYLWSPVAGVNQPTMASPVITVNETTLYTVSISSDIGCVTTDTVLIKIIPGTDIFVPQGFTPNNDGQNDRLFPILVGMRQLNYFKVFNRWGNMIFSTNSATPAEGWNGVYLGALQPTGAYTWIAEAVDLQGRVVRRTGTVMLLR